MLIGLLGMSELLLLATGEWRLRQGTRIARSKAATCRRGYQEPTADSSVRNTRCR